MAGAFEPRSLILRRLEKESTIPDTLELASVLGCDHQLLVGAVKSLEALNYLKSISNEKKSWILTDEGEGYLQDGTPEAQVGATTRNSLARSTCVFVIGLDFM